MEGCFMFQWGGGNPPPPPPPPLWEALMKVVIGDLVFSTEFENIS